jgi:hypothetical protein
MRIITILHHPTPLDLVVITMNKGIVEIGRVIGIIGVLPMIVVLLMVAASLPPDPPEGLSQAVAVSGASAAFIWLIISPGGLGIRSSWGVSSSKDIIKALLIVLAGLGAFLLTPLFGMYTAMENLINQAGAAVSIFGGILIIVGAIMKS